MRSEKTWEDVLQEVSEVESAPQPVIIIKLCAEILQTALNQRKVSALAVYFTQHILHYKLRPVHFN